MQILHMSQLAKTNSIAYKQVTYPIFGIKFFIFFSVVRTKFFSQFWFLKCIVEVHPLKQNRIREARTSKSWTQQQIVQNFKTIFKVVGKHQNEWRHLKSVSNILFTDNISTIIYTNYKWLSINCYQIITLVNFCRCSMTPLSKKWHKNLFI